MAFYPWSKERLIVEAEKLGFTVHDELPQPGDSYLAGRNTGPHLLTCNKLDLEVGCVFPMENAYPFDLHEVIKVSL